VIIWDSPIIKFEPSSVAAGSDTIQCLSYDNKTSFAVRMFGKTGYGRINHGDWIQASVQWGHPTGFVLTIFSFVTPTGYNVVITTTVNEQDDSAIGMLEFYKIGSSDVKRISGNCVFSG
jgi:hypothetical protein